MTWDAVIVGAGPAGAIAALRLAAEGRAVLLLDRRPFPREKVCGDALIPDALACLARHGLLERVRGAARALPGLTVRSPAGVAVDLDTEFLTLERARLDALLVDAALERGAVFRAARAVRVDDGAPARVALQGGEELAARIVVVATGADVSLLEPLGLVRRRRASAAAVRRYVTSAAPLDRLLISYDRAVLPGYGWVFPLPDGRFNVGVGVFLRERERERGGAGAAAAESVRLRGLFEAFARQVPEAREVLAAARDTTPLRGAALRCGLTGVAPRRGAVLAAGEALGATFPFTGEGIGKAMETGAIAAACAARALTSGDGAPLETYPAAIAALAPKYRGYALAERWLRVPFVCDLVARRVRRSRRLRAAAQGILAETADPRAIFSPGALIASLWS